jgi:hypothetical protein
MRDAAAMDPAARPALRPGVRAVKYPPIVHLFGPADRSGGAPWR